MEKQISLDFDPEEPDSESSEDGEQASQSNVTVFPSPCNVFLPVRREVPPPIDAAMVAGIVENLLSNISSEEETDASLKKQPPGKRM